LGRSATERNCYGLEFLDYASTAFSQRYFLVTTCVPVTGNVLRVERKIYRLGNLTIRHISYEGRE
jgi:hypothetical protein